MSICSIVLSVLAATNVAAAEVAPKQEAIILFGASWCAPCKTELRNLPELANAAAPIRIEIAWIDRAPREVGKTWPSNVVVLSPHEAQRKFAAIAGANRGLPTMAMIGSDGRPCEVVRQPAEVARIRNLIARCLR